MASREPSQTIRYLSWLYRSREANSRQYRPGASAGPSPAVPQSWDEMVSYLAAADISVPAGRIVKPTDDVKSILAGLRKPWVVKALPEQADHKTELGLVALGVQDEADVARHAALMRTQLRSPDAGILVQEMVHGGIEVVLSVLRNKDFGNVLAIGMGGTAVELFRDVTYLALPIDEELVIRSLQKLKLWTLLSGFRGKPEADIGALAKAAVALSRRFAATPDCLEIEINPLFVLPKGQGVIAIDALFKGGEG
jgi:acyl-CoA synthetase (NDP forming)